MINVSESILKACNSDSVTYVEYIIINGQKVIVKANLSDDSYSGSHFIGTFIMKKLEFETENDIDYKKQEFVYYREVDGESFKMGTFIVTDVNDSDTKGLVKVTAYDYTLKFANTYVTELDYASLKITMNDVIDEVCTKVGVERENQELVNGDFIVDSNQFDTSAQYGNVVQAVAQMSGNFAKVNENDKLEFIFTKKTNETIEDYTELDDKRDTRPITIVSLGMTDIEGENVTLRWEEGIEQYGENYLIINDNPFAYTEEKRTQLIQAIFSKVKGFGYSSFETKYAFKPYLQCGDLVKLKNKEGQLIDSIILRISANHDDITLSAPSVIDSTVEYEQPLDAIEMSKRTEYIVNKQEQTITQIIQKQDEFNNQLAEVEVSLEGISQKVENMADLTREVSGAKTITLENCVAGSLLELYIYGNNIVFDYLYPANDLYPSNDLYPYGDSRIVVTNYPTGSEEGTITGIYELGITEVLRQNGDVKDEYVLKEGKAQIIRRINKDGTIKTTEEIEELGQFAISLLEGTNEIAIKNYTANLSAKYAIKSDYTDIFATKVEMESSITQTAEEINLEVSKKVGENEVISKINQSAEQIQINANKISLKRKRN